MGIYAKCTPVGVILQHGEPIVLISCLDNAWKIWIIYPYSVQYTVYSKTSMRMRVERAVLNVYRNHLQRETIRLHMQRSRKLSAHDVIASI